MKLVTFDNYNAEMEQKLNADYKYFFGLFMKHSHEECDWAVFNFLITKFNNYMECCRYEFAQEIINDIKEISK